MRTSGLLDFLRSSTTEQQATIFLDLSVDMILRKSPPRQRNNLLYFFKIDENGSISPSTHPPNLDGGVAAQVAVVRPTKKRVPAAEDLNLPWLIFSPVRLT